MTLEEIIEEMRVQADQYAMLNEKVESHGPAHQLRRFIGYLSNIDSERTPPPLKSEATRSSHGGEYALGNAGHPHDSAIDATRRELWIAVYLQGEDDRYTAEGRAKKAVRQFDAMFGDVADTSDSGSGE